MEALEWVKFSKKKWSLESFEVSRQELDLYLTAIYIYMCIYHSVCLYALVCLVEIAYIYSFKNLLDEYLQGNMRDF